MAHKTIDHILTHHELEKIAAAISDAERTTSGEIRVAIRKRRHWGEKKLSLHQLAAKEFAKFGMQNTVHRSGVLIFLLLSERKFHIIGDEGIHAKLAEGTWDRMADMMGSHFRENRFCEGIIGAVREVGKLLEQNFPPQGTKKNELPDDVILE